MEIKLRTPNSELRTFRERNSEPVTLPLAFDEMLSQVEAVQPRKVLFRGEKMGGISSYLVGWMVARGIDVVVLDGANRFDPYRVSSFARKALIPPERLLKRIRIARAFTCYQMATLIEKLSTLFRPNEGGTPSSKPWAVLLGLITTFLDEDVSEREVRPLFERSLRRMEAMAEEGIPLLLFQTASPFGSKRDYLMKRLSQFSNLVWKISLEEKGPKLVPEKGLTENIGILTR